MRFPGQTTKAPISDTKAHVWLAGIGLIGALAVFAIPVILYNEAAKPGIEAFNTVYSEMEKIQHNIMEPAGAINRSGSVTRDYLLDPLDCIDVPCPSIQRVWFAPITPGQEKQFAESLLKEMGYSTTHESAGIHCTNQFLYPCYVQGKKNGYLLNVSIQALDPVPPPNQQNISPKEWRLVTVSIERR